MGPTKKRLDKKKQAGMMLVEGAFRMKHSITKQSIDFNIQEKDIKNLAGKFCGKVELCTEVGEDGTNRGHLCGGERKE